MSQSDSHKDGKLHAFQILCQATIQRDHDIPLNREHLAQFYAVLHETLHSKDQVMVWRACFVIFYCILMLFKSKCFVILAALRRSV